MQQTRSRASRPRHRRGERLHWVERPLVWQWRAAAAGVNPVTVVL